MHNYQPGIALDEATLRGLANLPVTVTDDETSLPVQVYRAEMPVPQLITGPHGFIPPFQTEESTRRVRVTVGPYSLAVWADEIMGGAQDAADRAESAARETVTIRDGLEPRVQAVEARQTALESAEGFGPSTPEDGQTASLILQPGTQAREAVDRAISARPDVVRTVDPSGFGAGAISAALSELPPTGQGVIRLRAGTYVIPAPVTLDRPVRIVGEGAVTISAPGNMFILASHDVHLEGLTLSGGGSGVFRAISDGLNWRGVTLERCVIRNAPVHFTRKGRTQTADGTARPDGTGVESGARMSRCEITGYKGAYSVLVGATRGTIIDECVFHDLGKDAVEGDAIKINDLASGTRITSNTFERTTRDGIDCYAGRGSLISGNTFYDIGVKAIDQKWQIGDVDITGWDIITNNVAFDCADMAFSVKAYDLIAAHNRAVRSGSHGFFISGDGGTGARRTPRITLMGNSAIEARLSGFSIQNVEHASIVGNSSSDAGQSGFVLGAGARSCTLTGNVATGSGTADFAIASGGSSTHYLAGNVSGDGSIPSGVILPNDQAIQAFKADGTRVNLLRLDPSGNGHVGHTSIPTMNVLSGERVNIFGALRAVNDIQHTGSKVGFFGTPPVTKPSVVPKTAEGIHAALVSLGLIS